MPVTPAPTGESDEILQRETVTTPPDYLFYRILKWRETCQPADGMPVLTTEMSVAILLFFNLLPVIVFYQPNRIGLPVPAAGLLSIFVLLAIVHLIWVRTGRYLRIKAIFSKETSVQSASRLRLIFVYLLLSIAWLVVSTVHLAIRLK